MTTHLSHFFDWQVPSGGMFVWATARDPALNTDHLLTQAMQHGVCITPSSVFDPEGRDRRSIRINFSLNGPEKLHEGVLRLAAALTTLTKAA